VPSDVVVTSSSPARTYPIPREVVEQALQGVRWARAYQTEVPAVHQYTAAVLAAGGSIDVVELNRLNRMYRPASLDHDGNGWSPGSQDYPCRELILASLAGGTAAHEWTERILSGLESEQARVHTELLASIGQDPSYRYVGLCASGDPDVITDVARTRGDTWEIWHPTDGWGGVSFKQVSSFDAVEPDPVMLAEIVAAVSAGDRLLLSYADPVAFLPAVLAATDMPTEVEGESIYAIVDEIDSTAVLDVLRISGETVSVRSGGEWLDEGTTATWLRQDFPSTLIELDGETARYVLAQVDSIQEPVPEKPVDALPDPHPLPVREVSDLVASIDSMFAAVIASIGTEDGDRNGVVREHDRTLLASIESLHELTTLWARRDLYVHAVNGHQRLNLVELPLVAAGGLDRNRGGAERLRRYWTHGKGALKIHWGVKGDWRRCYRQLFKYMGTRAAGYCQLRHKETTGFYTGSRKHGVHASANPEAEQGIMVALYPDSELAEKLALPGGEEPDELHVTLAYLGQVDEQTNSSDLLVQEVTEWARQYPPLVGRISGIGRFNAGPGTDQPVTYASVDIPALPDARQGLVAMLDFPVNTTHGFTPHMSLKYGEMDLNSLDIPTIETAFDQVSVVWGSQRIDVPFAQPSID
jgi:2'-5' RNA ligase